MLSPQILFNFSALIGMTATFLWKKAKISCFAVWSKKFDL